MSLEHRGGAGRIFYGWRVLAAAAAMRVVGGGFHIFAFSIFFLPLIRDLGLSRTAGSLVFSLARAEGAIEGPVSGYMIDRFGPRLVMGIGCLVVGVGYLVLSTVGSYISLLLVYLGLISMAFGSAFMHSPMALTNNWFIQRRAMAMSIISASVSVGGAVLTPLLARVTHSFGWRTGALVAGGAFLAIAFPLSRFVRDTPDKMGLAPLGQASRPAPSGQSTLQPGADPPGREFSVGEGMRTAAFWMLAVGTLLRLAGFSAVMVHFVPILVWKGIPEPTAGYYLSLFALFAIPTHLLMGWLGDVWYRPRVMSLGMALGTMGLIVLLYGDGRMMLFLFMPLFVVVEALFSLTWATLGDFFGRRHFATIRGWLIMFTMLGPVVGPVMAGKIYDDTLSYSLTIQIFIVGFALSSIVFWLLRRPST